MAKSGNVFPAFIRTELEQSNAFAEFTRQGASAADQVERHFKGSMDRIGQVVSAALGAARNTSGALDLNAGGYREAAQAATAKAQALKEVAAAAQQLAAREGELSGAQQVFVKNAIAAHAAAEREAATLREQAAIFDQLQTEINQTAAATGRFVKSQQVAHVSVGQMRAGSQQLSYQIGDVAQQFALGTPAMTIFAQQMGQTVQAVSLMRGATGGLIGFLAGPWGAALTGAATVIGMLVVGHRKAADATDEHKKSAGDLLEAMKKLNEESGKAVRNSYAEETASLAAAQGKVKDALATRERTKALLEEALARAKEAAATTAGDYGAGGKTASQVQQAVAGARVESLTRQLADVGKAISLGEEAVRNLGIPLSNRRVAESLDAITAADGRLERAEARLQAQRRRDAITQPEYEAGLRKARETHDATVAAIEEQQRKARERGRDTSGLSASFDEFGNDAADKVQRIADRFAQMPTAVEQAKAAFLELANIQRDLELQNNRALKSTKKPIEGYAEIIRSIEAAKGAVAEDEIRNLGDRFKADPGLIGQRRGRERFRQRGQQCGRAHQRRRFDRCE